MTSSATRTGPSANHRAFEKLYRAEVSAIERFAERLPPDQATWYRSLRERSDLELGAWAGKRFLDRYLEAAGRIRLRGAGVLAHAYLHVAYDFPRFLADSFADFPGLPREIRHLAYVRGSQQVWELVLAVSKQPSVMGLAGAVMRLLPGDRPAARVVGSWFLAHRCAAWSTAEILAASDNRAELEERLWCGIDRAGRTLLGRSPFRWIGRLPLSCDLVARPD